MRTLILLFFIMTLASCSLTPEPEVVREVVYETKYIKGVSVTHPERPKAIDIGKVTPDVKVINPKVIHDLLKDAIGKEDFNAKDKEALEKSAMMLMLLLTKHNDFNIVGAEKDQYMALARLNLEMIRWMKEANSNFDYYESIDLRVIPVEESSGTNLNNE